MKDGFFSERSERGFSFERQEPTQVVATLGRRMSESSFSSRLITDGALRSKERLSRKGVFLVFSVKYFCGFSDFRVTFLKNKNFLQTILLPR